MKTHIKRLAQTVTSNTIPYHFIVQLDRNSVLFNAIKSTRSTKNVNIEFAASVKSSNSCFLITYINSSVNNDAINV